MRLDLSFAMLPRQSPLASSSQTRNDFRDSSFYIPYEHKNAQSDKGSVIYYHMHLSDAR